MSGPPLVLTESREGLIIGVRARPRGRRDGIVGIRGGALLVETTAPPEDGAANEAIRRVLCDVLGVARADVALTAGGASRSKRFRVAGLAADVARSRLSSQLRERGDG